GRRYPNGTRSCSVRRLSSTARRSDRCLRAATGAADRLRVALPADGPLDDAVQDLRLHSADRDAQLRRKLLQPGYRQLEIDSQVPPDGSAVADLGHRRLDLLGRSRKPGSGRPRGSRSTATLRYDVQPGLATGQVGKLFSRQLTDELGHPQENVMGEV